MTIVKTVLAGLVIALIIGVVVMYWQYILVGIVGLLFIIWLVDDLRKPPVELSPEEWERRRRNALNYQIAQDLAERREAYREAQAQRWQQQQPPPRDPSTWGGGDGGRYC